MSLFSTVCFCEMLLVFQELPKMIKFKEIGVILEYMQNLQFQKACFTFPQFTFILPIYVD